MLQFLLAETTVDTNIVNSAGDTARDVAKRNSTLYKLFDEIKRPDRNAQSEGAACLATSTFHLLRGQLHGFAYGLCSCRHWYN